MRRYNAAFDIHLGNIIAVILHNNTRLAVQLHEETVDTILSLSAARADVPRVD